MPRRAKPAVNTAEVQRSIVRGHGHIKPPRPLSAAEQKHFNAFLKQRPPIDWPEADVSVLARLCAAMVLLEQIQDELAIEGPTIVAPSGTKKQHPLVGAMSTTQATVVGLARFLGLSASQKGGDVNRNRLLLARRHTTQLSAALADSDGLLKPFPDDDIARPGDFDDDDMSDLIPRNHPLLA